MTATTPAKDLALSHVMILVGDQEEALAFYTETIGFEVRTDMPFGPGLRWLTVGPVAQPGIEIVLEVPQMNPDPEAQKRYQARLDNRTQSTLVFDTDDVNATFARLEAAGAEVAQELIDQVYGVRDCAFYDPWGNHLRFNQPLG
jgi:uncharacterized glyoxalase superfamily protein PhnB